MDGRARVRLYCSDERLYEPASVAEPAAFERANYMKASESF